jgi:hypothetical protein
LAISTCDSGCHFPPRSLAGFPQGVCERD